MLENANFRRVVGIRTYAKQVDIIEQSCVFLSKHMEENKKNLNLINNNLIHLIGNESTLLLAYEIIKSKPGQMTKGFSGKNLDGINLS